MINIVIFLFFVFVLSVFAICSKREKMAVAIKFCQGSKFAFVSPLVDFCQTLGVLATLHSTN